MIFVAVKERGFQAGSGSVRTIDQPAITRGGSFLPSRGGSILESAEEVHYEEHSFVLDVLVCHACGSPLRILAVLPEGEATRAILDHLGLPTTAPGPRAHGPPHRHVVVASTWDD